jgi:hypothetical protein
MLYNGATRRTPGRPRQDGMNFVTPEQCRMARAGLEIGVRELAESARVSIGTVSRFEAGQGVPEMTVGLFQKALERAGVEFVADGGDVGVWLRKGGAGAAIPVSELNAENDE